ncbi:PREDICTED: Phox/Bem1p [Prunus dulcis]|uniref:PREDICTED: Phox/Bem1p n=1 Tax=Prunus dulcis TaxID=3755 RepID=A0A5E4F9A0_PRUDU|nr:uncharacterized protein LOC117614248 [Prunus dulcis]KAI5356353.1 hypothetical protein L3X38_009248 [Prunus dulcis]VVA24352.1 PREDICTED: Phox/Bem1p [Prunus dulcis]
MAGEVGGAGGESGTSSPKSRVKFLCSHGGKILPRPADGQLKYVGGETRVVSLSRDISFSELMKKLSSLFDGDIVLKYQLMTEDLDALVSVKSNEDLKHMLDEYNRLENEGSSRLRTFLFPSKPIMIENQTAALEHQMMEQRYIDAINGVVRLWPKMQPQQPPQQQQQMILAPNMIIGSSPMASMSISSACSSPKSASQEQQLLSAEMSMPAHRITVSPPMQKVHSSPSICSSSFNIQQTYQNHAQGRHPYLNNLQHHHANQSSFSARAHHRGIRTPPPLLSPGRLSPGRSESGTGRSSLMGTTSTAHVQNHYNNNHHHHHAASGNSSPRSMSSHHRVSGGGGGYYSKCCYHDECPPYACNRAESLPRSPR